MAQQGCSQVMTEDMKPFPITSGLSDIGGFHYLYGNVAYTAAFEFGMRPILSDEQMVAFCLWALLYQVVINCIANNGCQGQHKGNLRFLLRDCD